MRKSSIRISGSQYQADGAASAKALGWERLWSVQCAHAHQTGTKIEAGEVVSQSFQNFILSKKGRDTLGVVNRGVTPQFHTPFREMKPRP